MTVNLLRIFCSNVRGLVCNWSNARSFNWDEYDILGFSEIWQIKDYENLMVENFEIKTIKQRENTRGGGSVIFGRINLVTKALETPFIEGTIETTGIKVGDINFIQVYRPPSGNKEIFSDILTNYLGGFGGQKIILGGDFNLNSLVRNRWIDSLCHNFGLEAKITHPTRLESATCIDNYLTNIQGIYKVSNISIADHQAITAQVSVGSIIFKKTFKFTYREMKE